VFIAAPFAVGSAEGGSEADSLMSCIPIAGFYICFDVENMLRVVICSELWWTF
jgi:hypothetical protein